MEDGVKEEPAQRTEPKFLGKAGWVKKAPGRMLASYKDRYIHVEKTEMVVYENEDLKNCVERLDLEHYDKCQESKNLLRKKHRLVLIRSPKSGNKVHDVKFQAQTAEEKEAWIKALTDGINRAKNKVFDEVKVDGSINLEHVTRTRPKGNRSRRPPTRIHMKELAVVSSDGLLRLDLDLEDAVVNIGSQNTTVDGVDTPKESNRPPVPPAAEGQREPSLEEEPESEADVSPQKKVIKPPMPPTKVAKPISTPASEVEGDDFTEPPAAPSTETKPSPVQEDRNEGKAEKSPDTLKKTSPPAVPTNKPISGSASDLAEGSQSGPDSHPPTPPSKDKKPSHPAAEPNKTPDEKEEKKDEEETGTPAEKDDALPNDDTGGHEGKSDASPSDPQIPVSIIPARESPKMNRPEVVQPLPQYAVCWEKEDTTETEGGEDEGDEEPLDRDVPVVEVLVNEPVADSLGPLLCRLSGEDKVKAEDKSVDSGQHSDADSELSLSEDTLTSSTAALRGSNAGLDVLDDIHDYGRLKPAQGTAAAQLSQHSHTVTPLELSGKLRSASTGDLLSDSPVSGGNGGAQTDDEMMKLKTEGDPEMENEHLSRETESQEESGCQGGAADHFHTGGKIRARAKNSKHRKSW